VRVIGGKCFTKKDVPVQVTASESAVEVDDYQNVLLEGEERLFQIVQGRRVEIRIGGQKKKKEEGGGRFQN